MQVTRNEGSLMGRLRRGGIRNRVHARFNCWLQAELLLPEKALTLDGMISEISRGGLRFREASSWILDRRGQSVMVRLPWLDLAGSIVNVSPAGYGIKFDRLLPDEDLESFLRRLAA